MAKPRAKATREVNGRPVRNVALYDDAYLKLLEMQSQKGVMLTHALSEMVEWVLALHPDLSAAIIAGQTKPSWVAVARELARREGMGFPEADGEPVAGRIAPDRPGVTSSGFRQAATIDADKGAIETPGDDGKKKGSK